MFYEVVTRDKNKVKVKPRQSLEELWCDIEVGPSWCDIELGPFDCQSGLIREIMFQIKVLSTSSHVIKGWSSKLSFPRVRLLLWRGEIVFSICNKLFYTSWFLRLMSFFACVGRLIYTVLISGRYLTIIKGSCHRGSITLVILEDIY